MILGASAGAALGPASFRHVQELVLGIFEDVGAILNSFSGGPDDPKGPVTNATTLRTDAERLNAASRKAHDLAAELSRIKDDSLHNDR